MTKRIQTHERLSHDEPAAAGGSDRGFGIGSTPAQPQPKPPNRPDVSVT